MEKIEEVTDPQKYYKQLSEQQRDCRQEGHGMRRAHNGYLVQNNSHYETVWVRKYTCSKGCGTTCVRSYMPVTLEWISSAYDYPDEYRAKGTRMSRHDMRLAELQAEGLANNPTGKRRGRAK